MQPTLNLIRDGGTVRHLEPQMMDLLSFLATTGGRVVSKGKIIDAVWEGRFIAEATLTRSIADLRRASMINGMTNPQGGGQAFVVDDFELTDSTVPVPEPASLLLTLSGLIGIAQPRRRVRTRNRP